MKKLYVYADFDWFKEAELIGELGYESLRGADSYSFTFNNKWLKQHSDLFLSDDLNNYPGQTIHNRTRIYSDVFPMLCRIVGDVLCCCVASKLQRRKKNDQYGDYHLLIS